MAIPAVTYTLANSTTADADHVMTNFNDLIAGATDGTKSYTIDALTCNGAVIMKGAVTLGDGSIDDITVTGSLASSIPIKTNNSFDIGAATLALQSIYLGAPSSRSTRLRAHQSLSASNTLVLPNGGGTDGYGLVTDGSGNTRWDAIYAGPGTWNIGLAAATTTNAADTIKITGAGAALSATNPGYVTLSSGTAGLLTTFKVTADVTILLTGAHWGAGTKGDLADAVLHVYAINDSGTLKWGVTQLPQLVVALNADDSTTPTSITTASGVLVNTALGADAHCEAVGWFKANFDDTGGAAEDLWAVQTGTADIGIGARKFAKSLLYVTNHSGYGSDANNKILQWATTVTNTGEGRTFVQSATAGDMVRITEAGTYAMVAHVAIQGASGTGNFSFSKNASSVTTAIASIAAAEMLTTPLGIQVAGIAIFSQATAFLNIGDLIRVHTSGATLYGGADSEQCFQFTRVS